LMTVAGDTGGCVVYDWPMGYNALNDEIRDNATRVGSTTRCVGYGAPLQRNAFRERPCLVLAQDCRRADFKTSLVDYRLRQLRYDR